MQDLRKLGYGFWIGVYRGKEKSRDEVDLWKKILLWNVDSTHVERHK